MSDSNTYRTAVARTIERLFYSDKEPTKSEKALMKKGWVEEIKGLWIDTSERNDFYGLLLRGMNPAKMLYPNPAKVC